MKLRWLPIKGYEQYYLISNLGDIWSIRKAKTLIPVTNKSKYMKVFLSVNGVVKDFKVHRLVANAFIAPPDNNRLVHHIDGNTFNNTIDNLCYVTPKDHHRLHPGMHKKIGKRAISSRVGKKGFHQNPDSEFKVGNKFRFNPGQEHPQSKFKNEDVIMIKYLKKIGKKRSVIANMVGIAPKKIDSILYGYAWKHITI